MYSYSYDKSQGLLVGINSGDTGAEDLDRYLQSLTVLDRDGLSRSDGVCCVLVVDPEYPRPNPTERRRLAEARKTAKSKFFYFALVTSSTVARGVVTALNWIDPPPPNYVSSVHASFEEAVRWTEQRRGRPIPEFYRLYGEARQRGRG